MPLYDLRCAAGHLFERHIPLSEFEAPQDCACGARATRVISAPMFNVDQTDYRCPITDRPITSRREHENNLRQHNCRVLESGEKEAAARFRANEDAKLDKMIDQTVEKEIDRMPSAKRETLYNELTRQGLTAEVTRTAPNV